MPDLHALARPEAPDAGGQPEMAAGAGVDAGVDRLDAAAKARILVEALPYIRRFGGKVVVVKFGGNALGAAADDAEALSGFATDIVLMRSVGMLPVVVHGGGPQIGELMRRLGKTPEFRDGYRVTDAETLDIVRMVLVGKVNRDIVSAINVHGSLAVGVSGEDAGLIQAGLRDPSLGFVGDIAKVSPELVHRLLAEDLVPVVASIGRDDTGQAYNINADAAAGAIASALQAEKLVFLTDVEGIRADSADPASLCSALGAPELERLIDDGSVKGGMVPKARAAVAAVRTGVKQAHILDGRAPHALLLEFFTHSGIGTMVLP